MFFCAYLTVSGEVYQKSTKRKRLCLLLKSAVDVIHSYLLFRGATNGQCLILYRNNLVVCVEAYKVFLQQSRVLRRELSAFRPRTSLALVISTFTAFL